MFTEDAMSQTTATLPEGWSEILDEVRQRLDTAVAAADARIEQMPLSSKRRRLPKIAGRN